MKRSEANFFACLELVKFILTENTGLAILILISPLAIAAPDFLLNPILDSSILANFNKATCYHLKNEEFLQNSIDRNA